MYPHVPYAWLCTGYPWIDTAWNWVCFKGRIRMDTEVCLLFLWIILQNFNLFLCTGIFIQKYREQFQFQLILLSSFSFLIRWVCLKNENILSNFPLLKCLHQHWQEALTHFFFKKAIKKTLYTLAREYFKEWRLSLRLSSGPRWGTSRATLSVCHGDLGSLSLLWCSVLSCQVFWFAFSWILNVGYYLHDH